MAEGAPRKSLFKFMAAVEPFEVKAVALAFSYFFVLLASYYILRPIRDAMATAYGAAPSDLNQLFFGTFVGTLILAPVFAFAANRVKLSTLLPWVYGFIAVTLIAFYVCFARGTEERWTSGLFFCWISVFNMIMTSVFWSLMADIFAPHQAKRLFGLISAGGSAGALAGPAITALFVKALGTDTLLLISAAGFVLTSGLVVMLVREKKWLATNGVEVQPTSLDHALPGNPFKGFGLLRSSPYLFAIAVFTVLMSWVATFLYFEQQDTIAKAFATTDARAQAFAIVDWVVNALTIGVQVFGTGRIIRRFGITTALTLNSVLMVAGFALVALAPVLAVLLAVQIMRRVAQYALARPSREVLFTIVDQESKYKAKNVIDTVVYRAGDYTASQLQALLEPLRLGLSGIALIGAGICLVWWWSARGLGRRYERTAAGAAMTGRITGW